MQYLKIFGYVLLLTFFSCSMQEDEYRSNGVITGIDTSECPCCGGYFIEINKTTYRFFTVPQNSELDLTNREFPVYVKLDWNPDPNACLGDEIIVTRIKEQ